MTTIFCPNCGLQTDDRARFCQRCGTQLQAPVPSPAGALAAGYAAPAYAAAALPAFAPRGYGGFWLRVLAAILDSILLGAVLAPLSFFWWDGFHRGGWHPWGPGFGFGWPVWYGVRLLYYAAMESSSHQATVGKLVCGLRVTDAHGRRLSFAHAAGRYLAKLLSNLTLGIGYIMAGFTRRKQALHDIVAGTLVVKR
jgi:uncharacterized RDD family membrane protein YckC